MTTTTSDKKWYVVRAVSGQEAKIKDYIMSEISRFGYDHLVEDILVPTEKVIQIRNGKKINYKKINKSKKINNKRKKIIKKVT